MSELKLYSYKSANSLNNMAVFEWDIEQDTLNYDEMMYHILQHNLPQTEVKVQLLNARLIHPDDRTEFHKHVSRLLNVKFQRMAPYQDFGLDFRIYTTGRCYIWLHMAYRVHIENGFAKQVVGFVQNIDIERQEHAKMQGMVERDPMTGLYSKTHSNYLVNQTISEPGGPHALLVLDMDNFKQVNDKLGHLIGDAVILDVALSLKRLFRKTDILGHIGGDEFMVLLKDIKSEDIIHIKCNQLRDLLRRNYTQNNETVSVSASIGIALAPEHGTDFKTLFTHADAALYEVKRRGKDNQVIYSSNFVDKRDKVEEEKSQHSQEYQQLISNPLDYIFHMMFKSKDTRLTVQILLEIFAKYFNLQRAYVFWNADGPYFPKILFDCVSGNYTTAELSHNPEIRRRMWKKYKDTKYGRFTECEDTNKLSERAKKIFQRSNIQAYLECAVMDGDLFLGCVGFDDCKGPRTWSKAEYEVLNAFADILHRFLLGQMYYEMMRKGSIWDF